MQLRIQICSNDIVSVYSSATVNSSERSGGPEGLEIQDWHLQYSIILTIHMLKCLSYYRIRKSLTHTYGPCNAVNYLLGDSPAVFSWAKFLPKQPNKRTYLFASVIWCWAPRYLYHRQCGNLLSLCNTSCPFFPKDWHSTQASLITF